MAEIVGIMGKIGEGKSILIEEKVVDCNDNYFTTTTLKWRNRNIKNK